MMDETTLKVTNVLADPTRYSIYQYLYSLHDGVTVQDVADHFGIHPNVARLHLNKLEDVKLVQSKTEKASKSGRPGKVYKIADESISINFPPRDYKLLAEIALESIMSLGREGETILYKVSFQSGKEQAMNMIYNEHLDIETLSMEDKFPYIMKLASELGLNPDIESIDEYSFRFRVFNCPFRELAANQYLVCKMHHSILSGMFSAFFGRIDLIEEQSMLDHHCPACEYTMVSLP